ncbi:MAG: response regulator transcription factor [Methylococcales bacterium]|jgi:two-component system, OmpR family, alkaline phosphatase synthesis response regulator PhoP|nr:response regulator transcription factor [Methylococcales bacterium]MBT7410919.1 response regulator transcription factor [Methylococcales bacterium]
MSAKILVVDDEKDINDLIVINLTDMHYQVESCDDGLEALQMAMTNAYDCVVLDVMLPGIDGLEICQKLRAVDNFTPILMLTSKNSETDRVLGLEVGADDYLTKPFSIRELQARVKAMLRRSQRFSQPIANVDKVLKFNELSIDLSKRTVELATKLIDLTSTEFDLLVFMAKNPGHVYSRTQLLDSVWGYQYSGYEHTVNSHINRLRLKLEKQAAKPEYILTVWGVGYKFRSEHEITSRSLYTNYHESLVTLL